MSWRVPRRRRHWHVDLKQIGRELNVRYVLEGSVQRSSNRLRINVQLIDAETGTHLWAERFDKPVADLFDMQDEIVARLANTLGYELVRAEAQKSARSSNPDAIDLMMRGWSAIWQQPTKESTASARDYFERAIKIDPRNAEVIVGLAYARYRASVYGWSTAPKDTYAAQLDLITKATAINPRYAFAYYMKSQLLFFLKQLPEAIEAARTAVALDPNTAHGYYSMALAEIWLGRCDQAIGHIKQAFGLSPRDPLGGLWHMYLGVSEACLGQLDGAIGEINRAIDVGYRTYYAFAFLAAVEAAKGNEAAAKLALAEARRLNPQFTIKWFAEDLPSLPPTIIVDGWRKAGLPEV
jgi:adenylate cyclase